MRSADPATSRPPQPSSRPEVAWGDRGARLTRRNLALDRRIWLAQGANLWLIAMSTGVIGVLAEGYDQLQVVGFALFLGCSALVFFVTKPPEIDSVASHCALASIYLSVGLGELIFSPDWQIPLGAAMFTATLAAIRTARRRHVAAHQVAAAFALTAPALLAGASTPELFGLAALVLSIWALAACCVLLLEASERQSALLWEWMRLDPLTGVGNARLMWERLEHEIHVHARRRQPLSIVALDLDDFGGINERLGRDAGDDILVRAAAAVAQATGHEDTVCRLSDDELWLLLPGRDAAAAAEVLGRLQLELAEVDTGDAARPALTATFGLACFPRDAVDADALVDRVHQRLVADQQTISYDERSTTNRRPPPRVQRSIDARSIRGLSRDDLAADPLVWGSARAATLVLGVLALCSALAGGVPSTQDALPVIACLAVVAALMLPTAPPPGSLRGHAVLLAGSAAAAASLAFLAGGVGIACAISALIAAFSALRNTRRLTIAAHLAASALCLVVAAGWLVATGDSERPALLVFGLLTLSAAALGASTTLAVRAVERQVSRAWPVAAAGMLVAGTASLVFAAEPAQLPTLLTTALLVLSLVSLGVAVMLGLEAMERQGAELVALVHTDHLTGLGNRLALDQALAAEIDRQEAEGGAFALVALEVIESYLNSRGASEDLLQDTARTLVRAADAHHLVLRRRGHEFLVLLPRTSSEVASRHAAALVSALGELGARGHRVECLHALVLYPDDARSAAELLSVVDARLASAGEPLSFSEPF